MRQVILTMSLAVIMAALAGCKGSGEQEREFMNQAIRHHSPDVMRVDVVDSTVLFTHIYDGIIDVKSYTFDGDVCMEVERVYAFPSQMSALRHYRNAIEKAELYDNIEMLNNEVRYKLKDAQHDLETKGLTMSQLKAKFDKQIADAKTDMHKKKCKDNCKDKCK